MSDDALKTASKSRARVSYVPGDHLSPEKIRELFTLDAETGELRWRFPKRFGKVAGALNAQGYVQVVYRYRFYRAHRLVFAFVHGRHPEGMLDHINGIRNDNRPENLREVDAFQNGANRGLGSNNTSGYKGVSWSKSENRWRANVKVRGKTYSIGSFLTREEAVEAYARAAAKLQGPYRRLCDSDAA